MVHIVGYLCIGCPMLLFLSKCLRIIKMHLSNLNTLTIKSDVLNYFILFLFIYMPFFSNGINALKISSRQPCEFFLLTTVLSWASGIQALLSIQFWVCFHLFSLYDRLVSFISIYSGILVLWWIFSLEVIYDEYSSFSICSIFRMYSLSVIYIYPSQTYGSVLLPM